MPIRLLINGAQGKMGQIAVKTFSQHPDFVLVGMTGRNHDLAIEIKKNTPQVVIDLTSPDSVLANTQIIIDAKAHPVIGTTGLIKEQITQLQEQCAKLKLGGLIAPNFSLGIVLMIKCAQDIVKFFPAVEIIEMHHAGKLDSPSGTAIHTAEKLAAARTQSFDLPKNTRETLAGARGAEHQKIPIHAVRLPGLVAHEQIIFGGIGETLTLRHDTMDRQCFMPGLILACKKVMELDKLVYGLENIL
jgi:4-hydroxy-tetrahydrodipicolinate reductase